MFLGMPYILNTVYVEVKDELILSNACISAILCSYKILSSCFACLFQVRKGRSEIYQEDIVDVLDKQLLEGMGVLLTEEEQRKCEQSVCLMLIVLWWFLSIDSCLVLIYSLSFI